MLKLFAWEPTFLAQIDEKRSAELIQVHHQQKYRMTLWHHCIQSTLFTLTVTYKLSIKGA